METTPRCREIAIIESVCDATRTVSSGLVVAPTREKLWPAECSSVEAKVQRPGQTLMVSSGCVASSAL